MYKKTRVHGRAAHARTEPGNTISLDRNQSPYTPRRERERHEGAPVGSSER